MKKQKGVLFMKHRVYTYDLSHKFDQSIVYS